MGPFEGWWRKSNQSVTVSASCSEVQPSSPFAPARGLYRARALSFTTPDGVAIIPPKNTNPIRRRPLSPTPRWHNYPVAHALGLLVVLYVLWLVLSGHYTPLLLTIGVLCAVGVCLLALRMDVVDHESYPLHLRLWRLIAYWSWLFAEIVKSNVDVARRILHPDLPISPTIIRVRASQRTELGRVIYANSITLTPGTVSIDVRDNDEHIEVHALTREAAAAVQAGEMDRRVYGVEMRE